MSLLTVFQLRDYPTTLHSVFYTGWPPHRTGRAGVDRTSTVLHAVQHAGQATPTPPHDNFVSSSDRAMSASLRARVG
jgi:hypothetical protein